MAFGSARVQHADCVLASDPGRGQDGAPETLRESEVQVGLIFIRREWLERGLSGV